MSANKKSTESADLSPPTIAVTGAAGFIGSRVVHQLRSEHPVWRVRAIDNFYLGTVREIDDITVKHVDIRNRQRLEHVLDGADLVIHLAAMSDVDDCEENADLAYEVNVQGTQNVAWVCHRAGAGLIFPFSMAVLGEPQEFPVTAELKREPLNWYGLTKLLGEQTINILASDTFPAHLYLKSNLYGEHLVGDQRVSKGTVINFFLSRAFAGKPLTVYEPGTQARNYIHVKDVADAYIRSAERILEQLSDGETGTRTYEIASDECPGVMQVANMVKDIGASEADIEVDVTLVENPRSNEALVSEFAVDTSKAREELGWTPDHTIEGSIRKLVRRRASTE